jgi:hypothetical protein
VLGEARGERVIIRSLHADGVERRSAVKWKNLSLLDDQLFSCEPAGIKPSSLQPPATRASGIAFNALLVHCVLERFAGRKLDGL